jgi:hypothetical protein
MSSSGWILRACARPVGVVSALAIVISSLAALPAASKPTSAMAASSVQSQVEAMRLASATGNPVEITDKTTEYTRTFATPEGTLSTEVSNTPVRVKRDDQWLATDPTLEFRPDGSVAPKVALSDMKFSAGGNGPLAHFVAEVGALDLTSPWQLPTPTLSGSKATYASVLPDVDLVVDATLEGFSYNLVVKTRAAAANQNLRSLHFPVSTDDLELRNGASGRPTYVDSQGRWMLSVGEAMMWDSAGLNGASAKVPAAVTAAEAADGPPPGANIAMMEFHGDESGLTLEPDQTMLQAADTVFPVVLDPTMVGTRIRNGWTAAWELYPNNSFWKTEHSLGVGYEGFEQNKIVRSFFQFDVASFTSKKILAASLRTYETHSASCTARRVIVTRTGPISAATTWNNQPPGQADVATFDGAKGYSSSCPAGYVEFDVTSSVQYTSTGNGRTATFRLRAATENDELGWKQFDSTGLLTIEYVAYPLPATALGVATKTDTAQACTGSATPTIVASSQPDVSAKGNIGAGDNQSRVIVQIQIVSPSGSVWTMTSQPDAPYVLKKLSPATKLSENVLYRYHARTLLNYTGGQLVSAWSGDCYFKVDLAAPPRPTIIASYNGTPLENCLTSGDPDHCPEVVPFGARVTYTISSSTSDVVALSYGFNGQMTKVSGKSVTVNLETPGQTYMTLGAIAHDGAAHTSETASFLINVGNGLPPVGSWTLDDGTGTTAADSSGQGHPLTISGADFDDAGRVGGSLVFNGVGDHATASTSVVDTSKSFTLSAWARLTDFSEGAVVGIFGSQGIAAQLYYSQGVNRWLFMQNVADSTAAAQTRSDSVEPPMLGVWTHLLGVYDANAKTMTLYVNGRSQGSTSFTYVPWKATGPLELGWFRFGGNHGAAFTGSIDDVKAYPRILSAAEAKVVADPRTGPSGSDEPVAGIAANYPFESVNNGTDQVWRTNDLVYDASMTVSGFGSAADQSAAIVQDPERGNVLSATGNSGEVVSLARPVVDATGSFTVALWVRMSDTSQPRVIVRQAGAAKDSWRLEYRPTGGSGAVWAFSRASSDSSGATVSEVTQLSSLTTANDWTPLAAYYDAKNDKIGLRLIDRLADDALTGFSTPFRAGKTVIAGPPLVGTSLPFAGQMDDLRIFGGVVPQRQLCIEFRGETECS